MSALIDLLDIPKKGLTLIVGPPGAGKSTFACMSQLYQLLDRSGACVCIATEQFPASIRCYLGQLDARFRDRERELPLNFVDAYGRTVGLRAEEGAEGASCGDLNSISLAASQALERFDRGDVLVTLDSLTPIYMLNTGTTKRFVQAVLGKHAAEGHRVLATIADGVTKPEDITAIMSMATGILRINREADRTLIEVLKHPSIKVTTIALPTSDRSKSALQELGLKPEIFRRDAILFAPWLKGERSRSQMPDYIHILWLQLAFWGGMLWDPKRFPSLLYEAYKPIFCELKGAAKKPIPWRSRLMTSLVRKSVDIGDPETFSRVYAIDAKIVREAGLAVLKVLLNKSKYNEHYAQITEYAHSWGLPNIGRKLCISFSAATAGWASGADVSGSDWNAYETQCVGEGADHCEMKYVKSRSAELDEYLSGSGFEYSEIQPILDALMRRCVSLTLENKDEVVRPTLGSEVHLWALQLRTTVISLSNERCKMAMRLGGVHMGKRLAKELLNRGVDKRETLRYLSNFLKAVKVGDVVLGDTIKIYDCAEAAGIKIGGHVCFFTTGFLNGFLEETEDRKITKIRCVAAGDKVCEWAY